MDEETGEVVNYNFYISKNAETGEEEYLTYCLDHETGEKQYYSLDKICHSLHISNPFKISRYATHITAVVQNPKHKSSPRRIEFITALVFLLPTFIFFTPLLGMFVLSLDVLLHKWCHRKNARLSKDAAVYYKSPLHAIYKEFCSKCIDEEGCKKMNQIQDKRYNKRYAVEESLRRVVA